MRPAFYVGVRRRADQSHRPRTTSGINRNKAQGTRRKANASASRLEPRALSLLLLAPAGGRDNPVHAQVLDHLSVVIEAVADDEDRHSTAGGLPRTERALDGALKFFLRRDGADRLVN